MTLVMAKRTHYGNASRDFNAKNVIKSNLGCVRLLVKMAIMEY